MQPRSQGNAALSTGNNEGIGKAVAMRLGEEGAPVTTGTRRSEVPQRTDGGVGAVG